MGGGGASTSLKEILRLLETPKFFFCMTSRDWFSGEFPDPSERERGPGLPAPSGRSGARPCPPGRLPPPPPRAPHIPLQLADSRLVFLVQPPSLGRAGGSDDVAG